MNKKLEGVKKQYGQIVDELLAIDSAQKLNFQKFMQKI